MFSGIKPSLVLAFACSCLFANGCKSGAVEDVYLERTIVDMGDVSETSNPKAIVTIINGSKSPIHVSQLVLSCGCLQSDFAATTIGIGERLDCTVTLVEPAPGLGKQFGRFVTDRELTEPLTFELTYHVKEASYLHPESKIMGAIRLSKTTWPIRVPFQIIGLDDNVKLLEDLTIEANSCAFNYDVAETEFVPGGVINLEVSQKGAPLGSFRDHIVIVGQTTDGLYRYHVSISGRILRDL